MTRIKSADKRGSEKKPQSLSFILRSSALLIRVIRVPLLISETTFMDQSEYQSTLAGAGLFDRSAAAKLELSGPDAPSFLHNLCTNDVKTLPLGGGCEAYFCDSRAKVQFQTWVYHVRLADGRHAMWVETTPGRNEELLKY